MDRIPVDMRLQTQHKVILLSGGKVHYEPLYNMVKLNDIVDAVNTVRTIRNISKLTVNGVVRSKTFVEAVLAVETLLGLRKFNDYTGVMPNFREDCSIRNYKTISSPLVRTIMGRNGSKLVHPFISIIVATHLDKQLASELYQGLLNEVDFGVFESAIEEQIRPGSFELKARQLL